MELKPNPTASTDQISSLAMFRTYAKQNLQDSPRLKVDMANWESQLIMYWPNQDVKTFLDYLTLRSWSYVSPPGYIMDYVNLAIEEIQKNGYGMEQTLKAIGLFDAPDVVMPVHNGNHNIAKEELSNKLNKAFKTPKHPPLGSN